MKSALEIETLRRRQAPLAMQTDEFRAAAHRLVDQIADRLAQVPHGPVTRDEPAAALRGLIGGNQPLADEGRDADGLLRDAADVLFEHSLFNAHPRFFGYITAAPAPIGMLGELLAAALNQNVGAWRLAPMATEIEGQTVRWIAELIGFPADCGGLLVSGGNAANFVCFLAARAAKAPWDVRTEGLGRDRERLVVYASSETHTWIQKAADLFGLGTDSIRSIATDADQRMDVAALRRQIDADRRDGHHPFLVVGTAGSVGTGAVDPLNEIAAICRDYDLWFHVDGAYGALAALADGAPSSLRAIADADSVAVDPHKWLYAPLEAGCALVRSADRLRAAFSYKPSYYHFDDELVNYNEYGPQNSRGFRALKVWLALRQAGRAGYLRMIADDIALAKHLHALVAGHPELEAATHHLSITTFRYVPTDLTPSIGTAAGEAYLNALNQRLLTAIERSGAAFLSNAVVGGRFLLRACVVNFNTTLDDIEALPGLVARLGQETHSTPTPA
jgi:glutamate/tyrosine decarboxylase-like PLP-dependent enzyme